MKKSIAAVAALATVLGLAACAPSESTGGDGDETRDMIPVTLALTSPAWSAGYAPFAVAQEYGYLEEAGVDVTFVLTEGGSAAATQVAQGGADIGTVSTEPIMIGEATDKGLDIQSFYNLYRRSIFSARAPESGDIYSIKDLKGKNVGVQSLAAVGVNILVANLKSEGMSRDDVNIIEIGTGPQAIAALQSGQVDAVVTDDVNTAIFENAGIPTRDIGAEDITNLLSNTLAARRADLAENPEPYARVGEAMAKASLFTVTNPEAAIHALWKLYPETKASGVSEDEAMAQALNILTKRLERLKLEDGGRWGEFPEGAYAASVNFALETGLIEKEIDPDTLFINEWVDRYNDFDADEVIATAKAAK